MAPFYVNNFSCPWGGVTISNFVLSFAVSWGQHIISAWRKLGGGGKEHLKYPFLWLALTRCERVSSFAQLAYDLPLSLKEAVSVDAHLTNSQVKRPVSTAVKFTKHLEVKANNNRAINLWKRIASSLMWLYNVRKLIAVNLQHMFK